MIYQLLGKIEYITEDMAVIDVNGIGYGVFLPQRHLEGEVIPGRELKIHTITVVSQDDIRLFGFLNTMDRQFFRLLVNIPRLGPKGAMKIISYAPAVKIIRAIVNEDMKFLKKIPGVGGKVAKRIIVELQEKVKALAESSGEEYEDVYDEIEDVLLGLGCTNEEARDVIKRVRTKVGGAEMHFDAVLEYALQFMSEEEQPI